MILDWTKQELPWIESDNYFYNFKTLFNPQISTLESVYNDNYKLGLLELFDFYFKEPPANLDLWIEQNQEVFFDIRSNKCSFINYLIIVDRNKLDSLPSKVFNLDNNLNVISMSWYSLKNDFTSFRFLFDNFNLFLDKNDLSFLSGNFVYNTSGTPKAFQDFLEVVEFLAIQNGFTLTDATNVTIALSPMYFIRGILLDSTPMTKSMSYVADKPDFRNIIVNACIANYAYVKSFFEEQENKDVSVDWYRFVFVIKGIYDFQIKHKKRNKMQDLFENNIKNGPIAQLAKEYKEMVMIDIEKLTKPKFQVGGSCGNFTVEDVEKIIKTSRDKTVEDAIISSTPGRINILNYINLDYNTESVLDGTDFVGDQILVNFLKRSSAPKSLDEVYRNVLNYINFEDLLRKSLECLTSGIEIPKICIEMYTPFTLNLPDGFNFKGLFDNISELILQQILLLVQQIIMSLLTEILRIIQECEYEDFLKVFNKKSTEDLFVVGASRDDITDKLYENFDDFLTVKKVASNDFISFVEEVYNTLMPTEFCALISGNPTEKSLTLIMCILMSRYQEIYEILDTEEKVVSVFVSLGTFFNRDICDLVSVYPNPDNHCAFSESDMIRDYIVENVSTLSKEEIDKQIQMIQDIKSKKTKKLMDLMFKDEDVLFGSEDPNEFLIKQLPCASDNPEMRHMTKITVDAVVDSLSLFYVDAVAGSFQSSAYFMDPTGKQEYLNKMSSSGFVNRSEANKIKVGTGTLEYIPGSNDVNFTINNRKYASGRSFNLNSNQYSTDENWRKREFESIEHEKRYVYTEVQATGNQLKWMITSSENDYVISDLSLWEATEMQLFEIVSRLFLTSQTFQVSNNTIKNAIGSLVQPLKSPTFEDSWNGEFDIKQSILDSFLEDECQTRDPLSFSRSMLAGLVFLYVRTLFNQVFLNSVHLTSDIGFKELQNSFMDDFIKKSLMPVVIEFASNKYLNDIDSLIEKEVQTMSDLYKSSMQTIVKQNIDRSENFIRMILESLPVFTVSEAYKAPLGLFITREVDDNRVASTALSLCSNKSGTDSEIIQLASITSTVMSTSNGINLLSQNDRVIKILRYCFPTQDYLGALSMYNMFNLGLNSPTFAQIYDAILASISNIKNSDNFTYTNEAASNKEKTKMANSRKKDGRSNVTRILSLPWIFDILI